MDLDTGRRDRRAAHDARLRVRWAAIGAAVAVAIGAGTLTTVDAITSSGERAVYSPITPCRLADTRPTSQVGARGTPLGAAETVTIAAQGAVGDCDATDLPTDATALGLNVTALNATAPTFLTFWPEGDRPTASSLNPTPGTPPAPNAVTVPRSSNGDFRVYNQFGSVDVVIDVVGVYTDHDHDDRYYTKEQAESRYGPTTRQIMIPSAAFGPATVQGDTDVDGANLVVGSPRGTYYVGNKNGNLTANAPIILPIGSRITQVEYFFIDNVAAATGQLRFSLNRGSLSVGSQAKVADSSFNTSGASTDVRSGTVTTDYLVTAVEELQVAANVQTGWPFAGLDLAIKSVLITYEEPNPQRRAS